MKRKYSSVISSKEETHPNDKGLRVKGQRVPRVQSTETSNNNQKA